VAERMYLAGFVAADVVMTKRLILVRPDSGQARGSETSIPATSRAMGGGAGWCSCRRVDRRHERRSSVHGVVNVDPIAPGVVGVRFLGGPGGVTVRETFDAESENPAEMQRLGWQAILDNFARHVEARR